jgi:hypothetical protein
MRRQLLGTLVLVTLTSLASLVLVSRTCRADGPSPRGDSSELARSPGATCDLKDDERFLYWTTVDYNFGRQTARRARNGGGEHSIEWRYERATIQRLPKDGGVPQTLVEVKGDRLSNLNVDEGHLYWNGQRHYDVWRVAKAGGQPVRLNDNEQPVFGTVHDAEALYVREQATPPRGVLRIPKEGGRATIAVPSKAWVVVLGVDQGLLYWSERIGNSSSDVWALRSAPKGGGPTRTFEGVQELPAEVIFDDAAYFVTGRAAYRLDRAGVKATRLADSAEYGDRGSIDVDSRFLYWGEGKTGKILRVPKRGGPTTVAATGGEPCAVLADGERIFWIDRTGNRIMRTGL